MKLFQRHGQACLCYTFNGHNLRYCHAEPFGYAQDRLREASLHSRLRFFAAQSVVIGDTYDDVSAAQALGMPGCLVRTGWGERNIQEKQADRIASYVATDILDAARWVITRHTGN